MHNDIRVKITKINQKPVSVLKEGDTFNNKKNPTIALKRDQELSTDTL